MRGDFNGSVARAVGSAAPMLGSGWTAGAGVARGAESGVGFLGVATAARGCGVGRG